MALNVVLFVGGVGGAKLAYGLMQILPPENLTIIVNTGDDFWLYGLRICPDLDTILYTLSGEVDRSQGWGVSHDSTHVLDRLRQYGEDTWFRLGDLDLATHLIRTEMLRTGHSLTDVIARLCQVFSIKHAILPMTDDEVATIVDTHEYGEVGFQTYFVRHRWQPRVKGLRYAGANEARMPSKVYDAIMRADAIIIGPSNPWLSIAPILAVTGLRDAVMARHVPRVAISPIVGGEAIKGPTAKIMGELSIVQSAASVAQYYGDLLTGFIYDELDGHLSLDGIETIPLQTVMRTDHDKITLAAATINWIESLNKSGDSK